ncbi:MAG TPA: bifunctional proline dehydrogenase/L-glutamate gamma-semialdehyde dehydrogenase PutA, partial [Gammaproteobacteria bacterium]|nr:bifunctional proline dehydrogenase/L-glutamate gamma-semialdehyde dehydrogenase PutA [Gammaproteobacteria bacterium]
MRLVKGAYWDTEIKRAQQQGLAGYPVFTRKANTDLAYLACARRLLELGRWVYPQFASHNAHTVAAVAELAGSRRDFEFQRLHGMGAALFDRVVDEWGLPCRVYAPVGSHRELLPYLVRRLLENGANTSFVNRIIDADLPAEALLADPAEQVRADPERGAPRLPLPAEIYGQRKNSAGVAFDDPLALHRLCQGIERALTKAWRAVPWVGREGRDGDERPVTAPADRRIEVGRVVEADRTVAAEAMAAAAAGFRDWNAVPVPERAAVLERAADLLEGHREELMALVCREGGRSLPDALAEVREAADFCRYYALQARQTLDTRELPGPTGERNTLSADGRGVFACVSPWNFPVAIFTGQVAAALVAGNAVVAKPAHQTPLCGMRVVELLHEAGVPADALQFLPGASGELGEALLTDPHLAGVAFTGSTATARDMARTLAAREGPIIPLVAETGGQNALLVDSSALPEQVIQDTVRSAFNSAGQRCSALRVLFLQEEIADGLLDLLAGAMDELAVGDPLDLATDCGPVIDTAARDKLRRHIERIERE